MKKMILFTSIFFLIILLSSQITSGYTIDDPVPDRIGDWRFEIYGIDVTLSGNSLNFSLYTNYPKAGYTVGSWATFAGDLAIDPTGGTNYKYGIALTDHDGFTAGSLYDVSQWYTSNHYAPSSGYSYNHDQIVTIQAGTFVGSATSFSWFNGPGGPDYHINIKLDQSLLSGFGGEIGLHWASATCANDYINGTDSVSEPSTILLVGSGLIGLAGYGRKKFRGKR